MTHPKGLDLVLVILFFFGLQHWLVSMNLDGVIEVSESYKHRYCLPLLIMNSQFSIACIMFA